MHDRVRPCSRGGVPYLLAGDTACACVQVIELPIKHPELFESLGVAQPKVGATPIPEEEHA